MTTRDSSPRDSVGLFDNLVEEPLLHYRTVGSRQIVAASLAGLLAALARDEVHDFPALRPHQRHAWHAFLVQLAAMALHHAGAIEPFGAESPWRAALLALTPADPDGAAWCLVSPPERPAFMQAPVLGVSTDSWKGHLASPDELDMLVTSRNHDVKASRMAKASPEEWCFALVSLQTQEGFLGAGNYGISRMNGGFASRCGVGIAPRGHVGKRWRRDLLALASARSTIEQTHGMGQAPAHALVWVVPWNGIDSLTFSQLDPFYIEICRLIRLHPTPGGLRARSTGTKAARIAAKDLNGVTGDPWMPIDSSAGKALTITSNGFDYKLASELLLGSKFDRPAALKLLPGDDTEGLQLLARGITRGQGKTEGYHERRVPISKKMRQAFTVGHTDEIAQLANERIAAIGEVRWMLRAAFNVLFGNGARDESGNFKDVSDAIKERSNRFAAAFESKCDGLFFPELIEEVEAADQATVRQDWLRTLAVRAEAVLRAGFTQGPRNGQVRYRAQSAALQRLHGAMRGKKLPALAQALQEQQPMKKTEVTV